MADIKITDLPLASTVSDTDVMIIDTGAATKKIMLIAAWTDVSSLGTGWYTVLTVSYLKDIMGFVHLKGVLGTTGTAVETMFTLPVGYRPEQTSYFVAAFDQSVLGHFTFTINTDGTVVSNYHVLGDKAWFDGIIFKAA